MRQCWSACFVTPELSRSGRGDQKGTRSGARFTVKWLIRHEIDAIDARGFPGIDCEAKYDQALTQILRASLSEGDEISFPSHAVSLFGLCRRVRRAHALQRLTSQVQIDRVSRPIASLLTRHLPLLRAKSGSGVRASLAAASASRTSSIFLYLPATMSVVI